MATDIVGCCTPVGSWLITELILAEISVSARSGSKFRIRFAVIVLTPDRLAEVSVSIPLA